MKVLIKEEKFALLSKLSLGFKLLYMTHSPPYGLAWLLVQGKTDNTSPSIGTIRGTLRRPTFLPPFFRKRSTSEQEFSPEDDTKYFYVKWVRRDLDH